ncbi:hypothetical protein K435DRAFT_864525 [Dendrothele bispora CBS 962.96]|uniref:Uncharacterized protein n=1 Tax=Dendrothele bispora (strain CBS 962.96) TaxID=1314807 RepID=A0A4S8LN60_DENBC|nr:hypothetical protein K435DRAFT_864525 [Dendrothele bispora CBS 962.96]
MPLRVRQIILQPGECKHHLLIVLIVLLPKNRLAVLITRAYHDTSHAVVDVDSEVDCEASCCLPDPGTPLLSLPPFSTPTQDQDSLRLNSENLSINTSPTHLLINSSPDKSIPTRSVPEENNALPEHARVFRAYKSIPHPDELQQTWPLESYSKAYFIFQGTRIDPPQTSPRDITQNFVHSVSGSDFRVYKKFSVGLDEYKERFFGSSLANPPEVLQDIPNRLFDVSDPLLDTDLDIFIRADDKPLVTPAGTDSAELPLRVNNNYTHAAGVIAASVPGSSKAQYGSGVIYISDEEDEEEQN